jgi:hypothetical protein
MAGALDSCPPAQRLHAVTLKVVIFGVLGKSQELFKLSTSKSAWYPAAHLPNVTSSKIAMQRKEFTLLHQSSDCLMMMERAIVYSPKPKSYARPRTKVFPQTQCDRIQTMDLSPEAVSRCRRHCEYDCQHIAVLLGKWGSYHLQTIRTTKPHARP